MTDVIQPTYCANHPGVETSLRCKRCNKPICSKCAISTPTGYICKECENQQQKSFDTAISRDYIRASIMAIILSGIGSIIAGSLGFFVILLAPIVGVIIAEVIRAIVQRRRARLLFQLVAAGTIFGALPMLFLFLFSGNLWGIAIQAFYGITSATAAYQRLKGINIR